MSGKILTLTQLDNTCAKVIIHLKKILFSCDFVEAHRVSHRDFTRQRKLSFQHVFLLLLNSLRSSRKTN